MQDDGDDREKKPSNRSGENGLRDNPSTWVQGGKRIVTVCRAGNLHSTVSSDRSRLRRQEREISSPPSGARGLVTSVRSERSRHLRQEREVSSPPSGARGLVSAVRSERSRLRRQERERRAPAGDEDTLPRRPDPGVVNQSRAQIRQRLKRRLVLGENKLGHVTDNDTEISSILSTMFLYVLERNLITTEPIIYEAVDSGTNCHVAYLDFSEGRREATLRHYEAALRLDPEHTVALVNTATLMLTLHNNNQAEMLYKRALAVAWEAEIGESLGKLYLNTGRLEEAESTFTSVLTRHPHMLSSTVYLARVKLQQRSYLESEELLQKVLDQSPGHQEALFHLSLLYTHTNRTQDAFTLAQQAAHNCSRPPYLCARLHAHYGDLLNDRHNVDEAAQSYLLAVELEPTLTHPHINLGALYHAKGDYTRAWRHYLTAHGQEPSNTLLLENMEKLRRAQDLQAPASIPHCLNKS
ncbi:protein O-mannosyl-transferase TMTC1 [Procambarus clarkii]|uniref:protein O-mannosyl-transferase TMTC1 n=1 Tax=Procambarus clarkii TaxID=6728 RepID=UPI003742B6FD